MKITINESDVKSLVMESVKRILSELNVSLLRTIQLGNCGTINEAIINGRYVDEDDPAFQFDSDDFIRAYRQTESMYLANDEDLEEFYKSLLSEWMDEANNADLRSEYKNFEDYCTTIISDTLNDKYSEYDALKKYR